MNKKLLAGIGLSGVLMLGSVYSISANTSGYDLYKTALKNTHSVDSAALDISLNLTDNDQVIFTAESSVKTDDKHQLKSVSASLANETETSQMNLYQQDGSWFVTKQGMEQVYQMELSSPHHQQASELQDDLENLIDVMTKNLQQQITVTEQKNGSQSIELDLTGKEIPLAANAFSTLMIKHAIMIQDNAEPTSSNFHIQPSFPELDHDITVKQMKLTANVNQENYIEKQTVKAVVSGKDEQGKTHELVLEVELNAAAYNQTSLTPIEIPAENVEKFDHGHFAN